MGEITKHPFNLEDKADFLRVRDSLIAEGRLGGSDLGAAVGDNKYKSPYALWAERVGLYTPEDISEKEAIKQGIMFEDGVAKRFEKESGKKVEPVPFIFTNSDAPHLFASPDRLLVDEDSGLECKTAKEVVMKKFPFGDFPQSYYDQCACYLKVTGRKRWYLAIVVYGVSFNIYLLTTVKKEFARWEELKAKKNSVNGEGLTYEEEQEWKKEYGFLNACYYIDQESLDACEGAAANFIYRVQEGRAGNMDVWPLEEIDGSDSTTAALAAINPKAKPSSVVTFDDTDHYGVQEDGNVYVEAKGDEVLNLVKQRMQYKAMMEQLAHDQAEVENQLISRMKDKETFLMPGFKVTYKEIAGSRRASLKDVEAYFTSRKIPIPEGIITVSSARRGLRFYEVGKNKKKEN